MISQKSDSGFAEKLNSLSQMETARSIIDSATAAAVNGNISERVRVTLLDAATKLVAALQRPEDAITKLAYQVVEHLCRSHHPH
jgi:hypothetical protein